MNLLRVEQVLQFRSSGCSLTAPPNVLPPARDQTGVMLGNRTSSIEKVLQLVNPSSRQSMATRSCAGPNYVLLKPLRAKEKSGIEIVSFMKLWKVLKKVFKIMVAMIV